MHNVNVEAVEATAKAASADPSTVVQQVSFTGDWQTEAGAPQFRGTIPVPGGKPVVFEADFPPPMGGNSAAPNPLAYCFWGGLACYAMSFAQEAARHGVEIESLRARVEAEVDMSRALGVSDRPPVEELDWHLEVKADASAEKIEELKRLADAHCPGAYCIRNPIDLHTHLAVVEPVGG